MLVHPLTLHPHFQNNVHFFSKMSLIILVYPILSESCWSIVLCVCICFDYILLKMGYSFCVWMWPNLLIWPNKPLPITVMIFWCWINYQYGLIDTWIIGCIVGSVILFLTQIPVGFTLCRSLVYGHSIGKPCTCSQPARVLPGLFYHSDSTPPAFS